MDEKNGMTHQGEAGWHLVGRGGVEGGVEAEQTPAEASSAGTADTLPWADMSPVQRHAAETLGWTDASWMDWMYRGESSQFIQRWGASDLWWDRGISEEEHRSAMLLGTRHQARFWETEDEVALRKIIKWASSGGPSWPRSFSGERMDANAYSRLARAGEFEKVVDGWVNGAATPELKWKEICRIHGALVVEGIGLENLKYIMDNDPNIEEGVRRAYEKIQPYLNLPGDSTRSPKAGGDTDAGSHQGGGMRRRKKSKKRRKRRRSTKRKKSKRSRSTKRRRSTKRHTPNFPLSLLQLEYFPF